MGKCSKLNNLQLSFVTEIIAVLGKSNDFCIYLKLFLIVYGSNLDSY